MLDYGAETTAVAERATVPAVEARRADKAVTLTALVALALRARYLILSIALLGGAIGFGLSKGLTPRYVAAAQIYLDPRSLPGLEGDNPAQDSNGFINFVETQTRIITSQAVLERVVSNDKLFDDPEFGGAPSLLFRLFGLGAQPTQAERVAGAVHTLGSRILVRRPERTFIIDISATSNDPKKSARLANAVAQAYIDVRGSMHSDAARQAASSFTAGLDSLRERVLSAEKAVETYKAEHGFVGTRELYADEQRLKELNQQLTYARTRLEDTRSRYEQARRAHSSDSDLADIASSMNLMSLNNLRNQQAEASQRLADLSADLGPQHPVVRNAVARLAETKRLVAAELSRAAGSLRKDYERARSTEEALSREVSRLESRAIASAQASVKLRDLEREVEASRSIYQSFLTRARQTGEARQLDAASTHIITMATPPTARSFPPGAALMSGAGLAAGLAAGLGVAFLRDRRRLAPDATPEKSADDRVPESLAVTGATRFTIRGPAERSVILELTRLGIPFVRPFADRRELDAVASRLAEMAAASERPLVIGLVGDTPGAARTVMAVNIALALRLEELEVALVDADEKKASLTVLIEDGVEALGDARSPYVETRDGVLLALPSIDGSSAAPGAVARILRDLRRGRPAPVDVVLCDGVAADGAALDLVDRIVPIVSGDKSATDIDDLPEALRAKLALILHFDHPDPWLPRKEEPRERARKTA
jgi:succinoglycan biosynthesis transport protein ExoP